MHREIYDDVRQDIAKLIDVRPDRVAVNKLPACAGYVGVLYDKDGDPHAFKLSGLGLELDDLQHVQETEELFNAMLADEQKLTLARRRYVSSGDPIQTLVLSKALPKNDPNPEPEVQKQPQPGQTVKASRVRQIGGGRPRYDYPTEKKGPEKPGAAKKPKQEEQHSKLEELSGKLSIPPATLTSYVRKFQQGKGREAFARFMTRKLRSFMEKHALDSGFFLTLYDEALQPQPQEKTK